ncbi:MAG TPA: BON domain-containing protein [Actinomycetota bacterium]|nr:BON domain-containing protein [Actinomycetota bacterium]
MSADEHEYVAAHVHEALARDPRVNEPELQVSVVKDRVLITGVVPTEERRAAVTDVVREECPGLEVENRTTVARLPDAGDTERLR